MADENQQWWCAAVDHDEVVDGPGVGRVREDLDAGRLWKARDRVTGMFAARPVDQQVLALTAEVYFKMGDLPRAAAFWYLTDQSGPEVDLAMAAMRERYPTATDVIAALPIRDRIESFPQPVQGRLLALQADVKEQSGREWVPAPRRADSPVGPKRTARLADAGGALVLALVLVVFVVGLITSVTWLISAI